MEENLSSDYSSRKSLHSNENIKSNISSNIVSDEKSISLIKIISELLTDICEEGKSNLESNMIKIKPFISKKIQPISIEEYIERLLKHSKVFNEIIIIILIYLDTICAKHKINFNYYNIHKFILAAFIVAVKFHEDDNIYSINYYAKLGGVTVKEALNLEYEFLSLIDFKLFIHQRLYNKYYNNLMHLEKNDIDEFEDDEFDSNIH